VIARQQERGLAAVAQEAGADLLSGSCLKAALDLDRDDPAARAQALGLIPVTLEAVERYGAAQMGAETPNAVVAVSLTTVHQVQTQDVTMDPRGQPVLRQGVAKERRIRRRQALCARGCRPLPGRAVPCLSIA